MDLLSTNMLMDVLTTSMVDTTEFKLVTSAAAVVGLGHSVTLPLVFVTGALVSDLALASDFTKKLDTI